MRGKAVRGRRQGSRSVTDGYEARRGEKARWEGGESGAGRRLWCGKVGGEDRESGGVVALMMEGRKEEKGWGGEEGVCHRRESWRGSWLVNGAARERVKRSDGGGREGGKGGVMGESCRSEGDAGNSSGKLRGVKMKRRERGGRESKGE